jgi:hypothetical protein
MVNVMMTGFALSQLLLAVWEKGKPVQHRYLTSDVSVGIASAQADIVLPAFYLSGFSRGEQIHVTREL